MGKWGKIRIIIFSAVLSAVLFSGVLTSQNQACSLQENNFSFETYASPSIYTYWGQWIVFGYKLKNFDSQDIVNIKIRDDLIEDIRCWDSLAKLHQGKTLSCYGIHLVTQDDIDNGEVTNHATLSAKGLEPDGQTGCCNGSTDYIKVDIFASDSATAFYEVEEMVLTKASSPGDFSSSGEVINYSYTVVNTGTIDLDGPIAVIDDMVEVNCPGGGLAAGEQMKCTASYSTTENDMTNNGITNAAYAITGDVISDEVVLYIQYIPPPLVLEKTGKVHIYSIVEDLLSYVFVISNHGTETVNAPFNFEDPMLDQLICDFPLSLDPGKSYQCEGYYRTRESDLGKTIKNCATISYSYKEKKYQSEACFDVDYYHPAPDPKKEGGGGDDYPDPDA